MNSAPSGERAHFLMRIDEVRPFALEHFPPVRIRVCDPELRLRGARVFFNQIACRHNPHFGIAAPGFKLESREIAGSNRRASQWPGIE